MVVSRDDVSLARKDLHIGGLGPRTSSAVSTLFDPALNDYEQYEPLLRKALDTARSMACSADEAVRTNPWAAAGAVALVGMAGGYLLSRRIR